MLSQWAPAVRMLPLGIWLSFLLLSSLASAVPFRKATPLLALPLGILQLWRTIVSASVRLPEWDLYQPRLWLPFSTDRSYSGPVPVKLLVLLHVLALVLLATWSPDLQVTLYRSVWRGRKGVALGIVCTLRGRPLTSNFTSLYLLFLHFYPHGADQSQRPAKNFPGVQHIEHLNQIMVRGKRGNKSILVCAPLWALGSISSGREYIL